MCAIRLASGINGRIIISCLNLLMIFLLIYSRVRNDVRVLRNSYERNIFNIFGVSLILNLEVHPTVAKYR